MSNKINYKKHTLEDIHKAIRVSDQMKDVAKKLQCRVSTLRIYLSQLKGNFVTNELEINFQGLKDCTEKKARVIFKDTYDKYITIKRVNLSLIPFIKIHQAMLNHGFSLR